MEIGETGNSDKGANVTICDLVVQLEGRDMMAMIVMMARMVTMEISVYHHPILLETLLCPHFSIVECLISILIL